MEPTCKDPGFQSPAPYSLGEIEVYPDTLEVISNGISTRLEPKIMELLLYFSSKPGEVLSKNQILEDVWGGTTVVDEALQRAISILRKVLQDDKNNPRYIETISKKGYRLVVTPAAPGKNRVGGVKISKKIPKASPLMLALGAGIIIVTAWLFFQALKTEAPLAPKPDGVTSPSEEAPPPSPDE